MSRDYTLKAVRTAAILTNSYVAGTVLEDVMEYNQMVLLIDFTIGSLTTAEIKVEFSPDNTNWYQETGISYAAGTTTVDVNEYALDGSDVLRLPIPLKDRYVRISAKGTGTVTSSSMTIDAVLGNSN